MADIVGFENALGWAHFKLRGGWKTILCYTVIYMVIIGGLIMLMVRADPHDAKDTLEAWTHGLLGLQIAAFLLLGCSGISNAIRKDIDSGLHESHRLMPISGKAAVFGYLSGPTAPALMGVLANLFLGTITAVAAGLGLEDWLIANLILALFAIIAWIFMVVLSFMTKSALGLMIAFCALSSISGFSLFRILPGLSLLIGPMQGDTIFGIVNSGIIWNLDYTLSIAAQLVVGCLCYIAAARKYRRPDLPAFGAILGLALVASWILMSIAGILLILAKAQAQPHYHGWHSDMIPYQITASTLATVIVAIVPLASAIQTYASWLKRKRLRDPALGRQPISPAMVVLIATVFAVLLVHFTLPCEQNTAVNLLTVALVALCSLLSLRYLLGIMYRITTKIWIMVIVWLFIIWTGPILIDFLRYGLQGNFDAEVTTNLSAGSPVGVLLNAAGELNLNLIPGLTTQLLIAVGMATLYHLTARGKISDGSNT